MPDMYPNSNHNSVSKTSSGTSTPTANASSSSSSSYMPSSLSHAVSGFLRRLSSEVNTSSTAATSDVPHSLHHPSSTFPITSTPVHDTTSMSNVYTPPMRHRSPLQPPPLYPLTLRSNSGAGVDETTDEAASSHQLLSRAIAEEIRLLVPPRLQLCEDWHLVYSLEQDGVSLATLYKKCEAYRGVRNGFVLVVKDGEGGLFGAYLTEAPHPAPHYFGTGECFLWRASILSTNPQLLAGLPPPPSADTTNMQRSTTIGSTASTSRHGSVSSSSLAPPTPTQAFAHSGTPTPERIRFKAFPYSGVNDYLMLCETGFLSVGGGDGHYGLWLDDTFENGISSTSLTFGNEPLSDEGEKFGILGVEIWTVGNKV